jgi:hypothetical protein
MADLDNTQKESPYLVKIDVEDVKIVLLLLLLLLLLLFIIWNFKAQCALHVVQIYHQ